MAQGTREGTDRKYPERKVQTPTGTAERNTKAGRRGEEAWDTGGHRPDYMLFVKFPEVQIVTINAGEIEDSRVA